MISTGDLVWWLQGDCEYPGLVLDVKKSSEVIVSDTTFNHTGKIALVVLRELEDEPTWMHECELERLNN